MAEAPYVSVVLALRNDNYGGDLDARIEAFIAYYALYAVRHAGVFEFVVADWNPPADRPPLRDAFDWAPLGDVTHIEVSPALHVKMAGRNRRPMLDYIGRNVAVRRSRGAFVLVLNQDIFVADSIMRLIGERRLSPTLFYRADRCDFDFARCRGVAPEAFETAALDATFAVHRRFQSRLTPTSVKANAENLQEEGSRHDEGDAIDPALNLSIAREARERFVQDRRWRADYETGARPNLHDWYDEICTPAYYCRFRLHTNAAGDFLLASRDAFFAINGFCEATHFYMHLDAYAAMQLFAAGYDQATLLQPHRVYHADHDRRGRANAVEALTFAEHESRFSCILRGDRSFQLNRDDWGLAGEDLPIWRHHITPMRKRAL